MKNWLVKFVAISTLPSISKQLSCFLTKLGVSREGEVISSQSGKCKCLLLSRSFARPSLLGKGVVWCCLRPAVIYQLCYRRSVSQRLPIQVHQTHAAEKRRVKADVLKSSHWLEAEEHEQQEQQERKEEQPLKLSTRDSLMLSKSCQLHFFSLGISIPSLVV